MPSASADDTVTVIYVHRRSVFGASEARSVAHLLWPTLIRLHLDGPERSIHAVL